MIPVAKGRPRLTTRGGYAHAYTPENTRRAEDTMKKELREMWREEPITEPVELVLTFHLPIPKSTSRKTAKRLDGAAHTKKPDLDNLVKLAVDSMIGIVIKDDAIIWWFQAEKRYSSLPSGIEIKITY